MIVKCPVLAGLGLPVFVFEALEVHLGSEGALAASVTLSVLMKLVVWGICHIDIDETSSGQIVVD